MTANIFESKLPFRLLMVLLLAATVSAGNRLDTEPPWPSNFPSKNNAGQDTYSESEYNITFHCKLKQLGSFNLVDPPDCQTDFSQDLYGWGVRVGFYANWFSSLFANLFMGADDVLGAMDANAIFMFALEISMVKSTFLDWSLKRVDVLIIMLIGIGTTVGSLSLWGQRTRLWTVGRKPEDHDEHNFGGVGTLLRLLICLCFNLYGLWFWYSPIDLPLPTCDPRCFTAYVFGVKLSSGIHWLFFVFLLLWAVYWASMLVMILAFPVLFKRGPWRCYLEDKLWTPLFCKKRPKSSPTAHKSKSEPLSKGTPPQSQPNKSRLRIAKELLATEPASLILPTCNLLWYIFIIVLTENTLHRNRAIGTLYRSRPSSSPAQLIPFLIGVVSAVRLGYKFVRGLGKESTPEQNTSDGGCQG